MSFLFCSPVGVTTAAHLNRSDKPKKDTCLVFGTYCLKGFSVDIDEDIVVVVGSWIWLAMTTMHCTFTTMVNLVFGWIFCRQYPTCSLTWGVVK